MSKKKIHGIESDAVSFSHHQAECKVCYLWTCAVGVVYVSDHRCRLSKVKQDILHIIEAMRAVAS